MWHKIKHYVVQTKENKGDPHLLRTEILMLFLVLIVASQAVLFSGILKKNISLSGMSAAVLPAVLSFETNQYREDGHIADLSVNSLLSAAAELKAQDMALHGYFSHLSPNGEKPWVWFKKVGYSYTYAGENLAINFIDSKDVTDAWIKSPPHRANLENANFTEIGIGTADGMYEGKMTTFVVQFFATPAGSSAKNNSAGTNDTSGVKEIEPAKPASAKIALKPSSSSAVSASPVSAPASASSASSSALASSSSAILAVGTSSPEVLGVFTESNPLGEAQSAGAIQNDAVQNTDAGYAALAVHPRQVAKNMMIELSLFLLALLAFSIGYTTVHHGSSNFMQRLGHGIFSHKKHIFEVACLVLVIGLAWSVFGYIAMNGVVVA